MNVPTRQFLMLCFINRKIIVPSEGFEFIPRARQRFTRPASQKHGETKCNNR